MERLNEFNECSINVSMKGSDFEFLNKDNSVISCSINCNIVVIYPKMFSKAEKYARLYLHILSHNFLNIWTLNIF